MEGEPIDPLPNLMPPVSGVCPSAATELVRALAMSLRSLFIAADEIVVPGTKAACGKLYVPLPFLGIGGLPHVVFIPARHYYLPLLHLRYQTNPR